MTKSRGIRPPRQAWTAEQLDALRRLYPDFEASVVATVIGRDRSSIHRKANELGIAKSEAFQRAYRERQALRARTDPRVRAAQFPKGLTPWNKGKHVVSGGRSSETRFKKGQMSGAAMHNWVPVGSYRIVRNVNRPDQVHVEQKVSETPGPYTLRWTPVSRIVWERAHGPVPKGHMVVFKPGQRTLVPEEITLDRLECITQAENARRNHPRNRDPELGRLIAIKGAITRQVNRIKRNAEEPHQ